LESFAEGFRSFIPNYTLRFFSASELEHVICGASHIDVEDWFANTEYVNPHHITPLVITWYWDYVRSIDTSDLEQLLFFITGSRRMPVGGFKSIRGNYDEVKKFSIYLVPYDAGKAHQLPRAHTCFSQLELPNYPSEEMLRERMGVSLANFAADGGGFSEFYTEPMETVADS
jgi:hypothetical protein